MEGRRGGTIDDAIKERYKGYTKTNKRRRGSEARREKTERKKKKRKRKEDAKQGMEGVMDSAGVGGGAGGDYFCQFTFTLPTQLLLLLESNHLLLQPIQTPMIKNYHIIRYPNSPVSIRGTIEGPL